MTIKQLQKEELWWVQKIAYKTWIPTYEPILSDPQIYFMLDMMYSKASLEDQVSSGQRFYLCEEAGEGLGFVSVVPDTIDPMLLKIQKIYVMLHQQGKGIGQKLIEHATDLARAEGFRGLTLNVNRYNKAVGFYQRQGFGIELEEDIDIGHGYLMEDYRMTKLWK